MQKEQVVINKLIADSGKILTDGETFGRVIFLGKGRTADEFYEITEEEYNKILEAEVEKGVGV